MEDVAHDRAVVNGNPSSSALGELAVGQATPAALSDANPFRRFSALGYQRLVPVVPPGAPLSEKSNLARRLRAGKDDRGKAPGIRHDDGVWSGLQGWAQSTPTPADFDRWGVMGASLGILAGDLGDGTCLVLLDIDILEAGWADTVRDKVLACFGRLPLRIGRAPKAGNLVRVRGTFPNMRLAFGDNGEAIEILSTGKQFVAHGIHPKTGKPYTWPDGVPALDDVPVIEADALTAFLEDLRGILPEAKPLSRSGGAAPRDQASLKAPLHLVERAVLATPNTSAHFPSREEYIRFGYAIKGATQDDPELGLTLFLEWAGRWQDPPAGGLPPEKWSSVK